MAVSEFDKKYLSQEDQDKIAAITGQLQRGELTREVANQQANEIRELGGGYNGGRYGNEYILTPEALSAQSVPAAQGAAGGSTTTTTVTGTPGGAQGGNYDLSAYLSQLYANNTQAQLDELQRAYRQNAAQYDRQAQALPEAYDAARRTQAAQNAVQRRNFQELAAATGLNTGAAGQYELSQSAAYQNALAGINAQQANAQADLDLARSNLRSEYEGAIAQARAQGNASLANALYNEMTRVQGLQREDEATAYQREQTEWERQLALAQLGASVGDYSGLRALGINPDLAMLGGGGRSGGGGGGGRSGGSGGGDTAGTAMDFIYSIPTDVDDATLRMYLLSQFGISKTADQDVYINAYHRRQAAGWQDPRTTEGEGPAARDVFDAMNISYNAGGLSGRGYLNMNAAATAQARNALTDVPTAAASIAASSGGGAAMQYLRQAYDEGLIDKQNYYQQLMRYGSAK